MSNSVQFIRRSGKVLGPITKAKMDVLRSGGKLRSGDEVGFSKDGPWTPFQALLDKETEDAAAEVLSQSRSDSASMGTSPAGDWSEVPAPGFSSPAFSIPNLATSDRPRQSTQGLRDDVTRESRKESSFDVLQYLMPWRGETEDEPFWALQRWVDLSRVIAMVLYWVVLLVPLLMWFIGLTHFVLSEPASVGEKILAVGFVPVAVILWLALCHLYYILIMAGVDFLRAVLAIERNTR